MTRRRNVIILKGNTVRCDIIKHPHTLQISSVITAHHKYLREVLSNCTFFPTSSFLKTPCPLHITIFPESLSSTPQRTGTNLLHPAELRTLYVWVEAATTIEIVRARQQNFSTQEKMSHTPTQKHSQPCDTVGTSKGYLHFSFQRLQRTMQKCARQIEILFHLCNQVNLLINYRRNPLSFLKY